MASGDGKYTHIINEMANRSSAQILKQADAYMKSREDEKAMVLYLVVCNRFKDNMTEEEKHQCASANLKAGNVYYDKGDYVRSLEFYIRGLKICESSEDKKDIATFYKNIGNVYCAFQDYEKGASYYKDGYEYCKRFNDTDIERRLLFNLTGMYALCEKPQEARKYYWSLVRIKDDKDPINRFMVKFDWGLILSSEKKYHQSIAVFRRIASDACSSNIDPRYECSAYEELYKAFFNLNNTDSTLFYLAKCEQTAALHKIEHQYIEVWKYYSKVYEQIGNTTKAQECKAHYLTLSDSIFNMRRFDVVKNTQFQYEIDKTNNEIAELHARQERREQTITFQRNLLLLCFLVVLLITGGLIIVYKQKKKLDKSYTLLYDVNHNFLDTQERMKQRHTEDMEKIQKLEKEIAKLQQKPLETVSKGDLDKYLTSNLNDQQSQALIEAITEVMETTEAFCAEDFSLDRLAVLVGSNSKYVSQVINDTFHKNFSNYVNEYRVHLACLRLADTIHYGNYTVKAIGESLGYKSHTSFINVFRKITGLTPSQYQKISKEKGEDTL